MGASARAFRHRVGQPSFLSFLPSGILSGTSPISGQPPPPSCSSTAWALGSDEAGGVARPVGSQEQGRAPPRCGVEKRLHFPLGNILSFSRCSLGGGKAFQRGKLRPGDGKDLCAESHVSQVGQKPGILLSRPGALRVRLPSKGPGPAETRHFRVSAWSLGSIAEAHTRSV